MSIKDRLALFDSTVSSVACFGAEHRVLYVEDMHAFDVEFRRQLRRIVGPPSDVDWSGLGMNFSTPGTNASRVGVMYPLLVCVFDCL